MDIHSPFLTDNDFCQLSYSERLSLAKELTKAYGFSLFFPLLLVGIFIMALGALALGSMNLSPEVLMGTKSFEGNVDSGGVLLGALLLLLLFFLVIPFVAIGTKNLILHYIYGQEPESIIGAILKPAAHFNLFIICIILWFVINIAFQFSSVVLGMVPFFGFMVTLLATFFYQMVSNCSYSYMADHGLHQGDLTDPVKAISEPLKIVWTYKKTWVGSYATVFLLFFIPGFFIGFGLSFIQIGGAMSTAGVALGVLGCLAMIPVMIFELFFMTITYKNTSCRFLSVPQVFD